MSLTIQQQETLARFSAVLSRLFPYHNESFGFFNPDDTVYITCGLDSRNTWTNGYIENSRYGKFSIEPTGNIKLFSGGQCSKFRACKFKDLENFERKLSEWKEKTEAEYPI